MKLRRSIAELAMEGSLERRELVRDGRAGEVGDMCSEGSALIAPMFKSCLRSRGLPAGQ